MHIRKVKNDIFNMQDKGCMNQKASPPPPKFTADWVILESMGVKTSTYFLAGRF